MVRLMGAGVATSRIFATMGVPHRHWTHCVRDLRLAAPLDWATDFLTDRMQDSVQRCATDDHNHPVVNVAFRNGAIDLTAADAR